MAVNYGNQGLYGRGGRSTIQDLLAGLSGSQESRMQQGLSPGGFGGDFVGMSPQRLKALAAMMKLMAGTPSTNPNGGGGTPTQYQLQHHQGDGLFGGGNRTQGPPRLAPGPGGMGGVGGVLNGHPIINGGGGQPLQGNPIHARPMPGGGGLNSIHPIVNPGNPGQPQFPGIGGGVLNMPGGGPIVNPGGTMQPYMQHAQLNGPLRQVNPLAQGLAGLHPLAQAIIGQALNRR